MYSVLVHAVHTCSVDYGFLDMQLSNYARFRVSSCFWSLTRDLQSPSSVKSLSGFQPACSCQCMLAFGFCRFWSRSQARLGFTIIGSFLPPAFNVTVQVHSTRVLSTCTLADKPIIVFPMIGSEQKPWVKHEKFVAHQNCRSIHWLAHCHLRIRRLLGVYGVHSIQCSVPTEVVLVVARSGPTINTPKPVQAVQVVSLLTVHSKICT